MVFSNFLGIGRDDPAYIVSILLCLIKMEFYARVFPENIIIGGHSALLYIARSLSPSGIFIFSLMMKKI